MNKFFLKFYWIVFGILLFVGGILFLLLNHVDTLYKFVPADAENYLHVRPKSLNELSEAQRIDVYIWLKSNSSISEEAWEKILETDQRELGLFSLNGQIFGIAHNNKFIKLALNSNNVDYTENNHVLYFPKLIIENTFLNKEAWFKNIRQRICFQNFILYSHNLNSLHLNMPLLKNTEIPTITFLGNINSSKINLELLGNVGQTKSKPIDNTLKVLPTSTLSYFRNLRIEDITKFNTVSNDLEFSIIQKLDGGIEYYKDQNGSQVKITKTTMTLDQVKTVVLASLAQQFPSRKERLLPDGSSAINLIADKKAWEFIEFSPGNWILQTKDSLSEAQIKFSIKETAMNYTLTFNVPNFSGNNTTKCALPKFSKNGIIFKQLGNPNFKNILILNKNQKKLSICID